MFRFNHSVNSNNTIIDDGRVPSLFKSFTKLLSPPKQEEPTEEDVGITPRFLAF